MTTAKTQHANNVVIGAGELYIDLLDSDGGLTGERYIGDTVQAALSVQTELTTVFGGDGATAEKLEEFARSVERTINITLHDISPENLALFIVGGDPEDSAAIAATAVADEEIKVVQGRWYQLGQTATKPGGVRAVGSSSVTVTSSDGATTYDEGSATDGSDDYTLDAANGRIYIIPGGAIASSDAETIKVDYTPTAASAGARKVVKTGDARQVLAAVRYIETPSTGKGRDIYARRCAITASGEMALKSRDTEQQFSLSCAVLEPSGTAAALYVDGEPA